MTDFRNRVVPRRIGDVLSRGDDNYVLILGTRSRQSQTYTTLELVIQSCEGGWFIPPPKEIPQSVVERLYQVRDHIDMNPVLPAYELFHQYKKLQKYVRIKFQDNN